jgi:hypothetical protein
MSSRGGVLAAAVLLIAAVPAAAQQAVPRIGGEIRQRTEYDRRDPGQPTDFYTLLRSRLGVAVEVGERAGLFVQLQDARTWGEESSTLDGSAAAFDLHQGWMELRGAWSDVGLVFRAGRQEIALGNERLVGAVDWSNTGRSFDGARLIAAPPDRRWVGHLFLANAAERGRLRSPEPPAPDHLFLGTWAATGPGELFLLHDRKASHRGVREVDRSTAGGRMVLGLPTLRLDLEGAYQFGRGRGIGGADVPVQTIAAWMAAFRLGTAPPPAPFAATAGLDWLSGDAEPDASRYGAFNTLYGTNHRYYGYMDLFLDPALRTADRGLVDALAGVRYQLTPRLRVHADLHQFWTAAGGRRPLGMELDLVAPLTVAEVARLELGYSLFRAASGAESLGLAEAGRVLQWGYAQLRMGF